MDVSPRQMDVALRQMNVRLVELYVRSDDAIFPKHTFYIKYEISSG